MFDTGGIILDGELMLPHLEHGFQATMKAIKKSRPETDGLLEYHVYDAFIPDAPDAGFGKRYTAAFKATLNRGANIIIVQTEIVHEESGIARWHEYFTHPDQGFEGTILRTPGGSYTAGHRSVNLLKHKDFVDEEYEIVAVGEGKGKFEGAIMFTCVTPEGRTFDCGLKGSMDDRREMFGHKDDYIGRLLTVKYQNLTEDNIPRFPVGVSIREPEQG
jgi:DNA ligase-1